MNKCAMNHDVCTVLYHLPAEAGLVLHSQSTQDYS